MEASRLSRLSEDDKMLRAMAMSLRGALPLCSFSCSPLPSRFDFMRCLSTWRTNLREVHQSRLEDNGGSVEASLEEGLRKLEAWLDQSKGKVKQRLLWQWRLGRREERLLLDECLRRRRLATLTARMRERMMRLGCFSLARGLEGRRASRRLVRILSEWARSATLVCAWKRVQQGERRHMEEVKRIEKEAEREMAGIKVNPHTCTHTCYAHITNLTLSLNLSLFKQAHSS